ncbi:MAG: InlB B-repeat-containing protein, partial [Clostridia bacterium]|nr:InlB B-repeat-containing protein [Clostridia bacterium]
HETSDVVKIENPAGLLKQPDISTGYLGGLSYVVAKYQTGTSYSASETYNAGTPVFVDIKGAETPGAELSKDTLVLTQNLPDVTMGGESYVVVYKIDVDYLKQTETYYVSYLVVNNTSMVISDETQDKNIINVDGLTSNKLYLFGYTTDGETCSPLQNNVLFKCVDFTLASYVGIEDKYHVRLSNMTGYAASTHSEIYYKLEKEATGNTVKYYINLGTLYKSYNKAWDKDDITIAGTTKLFNNELIADLDIMSNATKVVGIAGYKDNYKAGFKLKGNTYISSKYSMSLGGMFRSDETESISFIYAGNTLPAAAAKTYFNGASSVETIGDGKAKTYCGNTYTLYQLKVSSTNTGNLYNLISTSYYALKSSITINSNPAVIRPNYGMNLYFNVGLGEEKSEFNLQDSVKYYTCTSGGFSEGIVETLYDADGNVIDSIEPSINLTQYKEDNKELNYFKQTDCTVYLDANAKTKIEFAVWWKLPKEITVKFAINTSDVPTPQDVTVYYGDGNTFGDVLPTTLTRDGYTFAGWFLNEAYTGAEIKSESVVTLAKSTDTTITLYAKWTENT